MPSANGLSVINIWAKFHDNPMMGIVVEQTQKYSLKSDLDLELTTQKHKEQQFTSVSRKQNWFLSTFSSGYPFKSSLSRHSRKIHTRGSAVIKILQRIFCLNDFFPFLKKYNIKVKKMFFVKQTLRSIFL